MWDSIGLLFISFLLISGVNSKKASPYEPYSPDQIAYYSCSAVVGTSATFCNITLDPACRCSNPYFLATLVGCMDLDLNTNTSNHQGLIDSCAERLVILTDSQIEEARKNYTKYAKPVTEIKGFNFTKVLTVPIVVDDATRTLNYRAYYKFMNNLNDTLYYASGLLGYWGLVFVLAAFFNWGKVLFPGLVKRITGKIPNKFRKHVTMAAVNRTKTREKTFLKIFQFLIPSRLESIIVTGFVILTIVVCAVDISYIDGDPVLGARGPTLSRYVGDRTGIIVVMLMPLFILFAGRNNFLQWLTRWNFASFIAYHRWVGRVAVILVFVHAVCYTIAFRGYYVAEMKEAYLRWGVVAACAGCIILVQGMLYLRRKWYEVFLIIHILMAIFFIVGAWYHVRDLGYGWMNYASIAVWAFDRVVRLGRLFWFGFPESQVILLADETLKVVVPKPKYWQSVPGGHAFIHFLRPSCFWQSHPFTFTESSENGNSIILYCKVKGGVTHSLNRYLVTHPGKTTTIRVALEGPYGESTAAKNYDKAVFVAGGNGIPGIYSEIFDLAKRSSNHTNKVLKLVWIVREYRSLYWFYEELISLKNTNIETTIYVTNPSSRSNIEDFYKRIPQINDRSSSSDSAEVIQEENNRFEDLTDEKSIDKNSEKMNDELTEEEELKSKDAIIETVKTELSHITFKEGRPSLEVLVQQEVEESPGSIAFVTCGHPMMVDDLRYSVGEVLDKAEGKRVDFFEQLQVWT